MPDTTIARSRFKNSVINTISSMGSQLLAIVLNIICRRVFLETLSTEYLGVSTTFSSILSILSLTELGVGSAIIYSLYKPIATDDKEKIKSLMKLYQRVYQVVGLVILVVGCSLTPFLHFFVNEMPDIPGLSYIYILLVIQNASTYFFSYKINFLTATQQNYISQRYYMVFYTLQIALQIVFLFLFRSYFIYLLTAIVLPLIKNVILTAYINKLYPFLKEKAQKLDSEETGKIKKNVFAIFLYKISSKLSSTIDTLLISKVMGVLEVAIYSNYHLIISYSDLLFINVIGAITPSVGNLMATNEDDKKRRFFSTMQMLYYWAGTFLAVGMIVLYNPLIELWLGKDFLFPQIMVVALVVSMTLTNFQRPCAMVRDASGLFWYGKFRPLAMIIINLVAATILAKKIGSVGVVLGTIISKVATYVWYDPYIVYKFTLKKGLNRYFVKYAMQWLLLAFLSFVCHAIYQILPFDGLAKMLVGVVMVTVIVNVVMLIIYFKTKEFEYLIDMIKDYVLKRSSKK